MAASRRRRPRRPGGTLGRLADWLFGDVSTAPLPGAVEAAAGRVALARAPATTDPPPWGFGPPLAPFDFPDMAPPWWDRDAAMSLPTISRCRDLICTAVAALPFTLWVLDITSVPAVEQRIPPAGWMERPDPDRTRQWLLSWTVDDLFFYERAHWQITGRYTTTYPSSFRRIPPGDLEADAGGETVTVTDPGTGKRRQVSARDIVEFLSPIEGLLTNGYRAISTALQLDAAAERFSANELPTGILQEQDGGEDMSADDLRDNALAFAQARQSNTTAALNKYLRYEPVPNSANEMQLVEGRTYQALELSRLGNVPPYLVGAPAGGGMTYQNAVQAKGDLIDFGAAPYLGCIEQTLSGPNVTPRGQAVRLDQNAWLRNPFTTPPTPAGGPGTAVPNDLQIADPTQPPTSPTAVPA